MTDKKLVWPEQDEEQESKDKKAGEEGVEDEDEGDEEEEEEEQGALLQQMDAERAQQQALTAAQLKAVLQAEEVEAGTTPRESINLFLQHRARQRVFAQLSPTIDPAIDASLWEGPSACIAGLDADACTAKPVSPYDVWLTRLSIYSSRRWITGC